MGGKNTLTILLPQTWDYEKKENLVAKKLAQKFLEDFSYRMLFNQREECDRINTAKPSIFGEW